MSPGPAAGAPGLAARPRARRPTTRGTGAAGGRRRAPGQRGMRRQASRSSAGTFARPSRVVTKLWPAGRPAARALRRRSHPFTGTPRGEDILGGSAVAPPIRRPFLDSQGTVFKRSWGALPLARPFARLRSVSTDVNTTLAALVAAARIRSGRPD